MKFVAWCGRRFLPRSPTDRRHERTVLRGPERLEARELLAHGPPAPCAFGGGGPHACAIARIVAEVQEAGVEGHFINLGVDQGDSRGYDGPQPQDGLVQARRTIADALGAALVRAGGTVTLQDFDAGGYAGVNIVGVLPGHGPDAGEQLLIGAHYDSADAGPGADDAASGVAGVLEAADVLAQHPFDRTLVFVLFDQEEQRTNGWGQGGRYFARNAAAQHEDIRASLILDQMGFNWSGTNVVTVGPPDTQPRTPSAMLAHAVAAAYRQYTDLNVVYSAGQNGTDAYRLYQAGFPATSIEEAEDARGNPRNPFTETPNDYYRDSAGNLHRYRGAAFIDLGYTTEMTRGGVAWAAGAAGLMRRVPAGRSERLADVGHAVRAIPERTVLDTGLLPVSAPVCREEPPMSIAVERRVEAREATERVRPGQGLMRKLLVDGLQGVDELNRNTERGKCSPHAEREGPHAGREDYTCPLAGTYLDGDAGGSGTFSPSPIR